MTSLLLAALPQLSEFVKAYDAAHDDLERGRAFACLDGVTDPAVVPLLAPMLARASDPIRLKCTDVLGAQAESAAAARELLAAIPAQSSAEVSIALLRAFGSVDVEAEALGIVVYLRGRDEAVATAAVEVAGRLRAGALVMPLMVRAAELDDGPLRAACLAALRETTGQALETPQAYLQWWRIHRWDFKDPE